jgi:hypothetical protein
MRTVEMADASDSGDHEGTGIRLTHQVVLLWLAIGALIGLLQCRPWPDAVIF